MRKIRLAIVDDHPVVRDGIERILSREEDISVIGSCADGRAALALVRETAPDVLLLDLSLPDMDGFALIESIHRCGAETRILILSMHAEPEFAEAGRARGASGLVSKSASPESLLTAIRSVARGATLEARPTLTPREREILDLICSGLGNEDIAHALGIRPKTVENHCQNVMRKLQIHTRAGLAAYGRRLVL